MIVRLLFFLMRKLLRNFRTSRAAFPFRPLFRCGLADCVVGSWATFGVKPALSVCEVSDVYFLFLRSSPISWVINERIDGTRFLIRLCLNALDGC